jgi:cysteine desulfurase / selenocysteine lyase
MKKEDFPILQENLVYLDNTATTQKPQIVIDAISNFYTKSNANVHRGIYALSEESSQLYEEAHKVVADFINCQSDEIIFTSGTTASLNMLANMLKLELQEGDEIILSIMEHHSNLIPWQIIAKEKKAVLKFIPLGDDYQLDMEEAKKLITNKTKIVSLAHISNVLGTKNPVKELAELAHQNNALFVVDAAQSVPHMPVDVKELDCDFLVFSGHKICGPTGIGVLYGKEELLNKLEPSIFGGGMIKEATLEKASWNDLPYKFEAGTPPIAQAIGLKVAIEYLQSIGMQNIQDYCNELTKYALEKLQAINGLTIIGPVENTTRGPVISFVLDNIHPHDIAEILANKEIAVRAGMHCAMPLMQELKINGTTRASFYFYNSKEDVDSLVSGINKVLEVFK